MGNKLSNVLFKINNNHFEIQNSTFHGTNENQETINFDYICQLNSLHCDNIIEE
jgi:hypothetical protein